MTALRDVPLLSRSRSTNSLLKPRLLSESTPSANNAQDRASNQNLSSDSPETRKARQSRKPSPGLAARLKALGFGKDPTSPSPAADRVGRIPEDQLRQLDQIHQASTQSASAVPRRGRPRSGSTGGLLTPQATGGSNFEDITAGDSRLVEVGTRRTSSITSSDDKAVSTRAEQLEMDSQKYRLPDHTNGNGTKAMFDTKQAHIERDASVDENSVPPTPISKDTPPIEFSGDVSSYFNPFGLHRTGSVYTLSRVSFADQLAQLTSLQLPDAESLSTKVSAIPTSKAASKALMGAAEQIRSWISKAYDVISGLDGDDDVEWAAAGGREGLEEVDSAITRFEELINVYVSAIESLQGRKDISTVPSDELKNVVLQVETILSEWAKMRDTLREVKNSVEIAMEWEELWNTVLGDIGNEMDVLVRLVFEMEEKRHKSLMAETGGDGLDIKELENIVEDIPLKPRPQANNRISMRTAFPLSPGSPQPSTMTQDDSSLLALIARMQPLRASLDFLPMRLSTFHARAEKTFPTACQELETRREGLEAKFKTLEKDAETLRKELGEDRWVLVFRGAGRQAQKMYESVDRSLVKLKESIENGSHLNNPASMGKRIESYEAKKMHYGPAIERVLSIIDKGLKDRLTVNGEITRLHSDMQRKWDTLKEQMNELDISLEEIQADKRNQQLRDSISSLVSNDRSTLGSLNDTPGSSPASSVVMTSFSRELDPSTPVNARKLRPRTESHLPKPGLSRNSSAPASSNQPYAGQAGRLSTYGGPGSKSSPAASRQDFTTPATRRLSRTPAYSTTDGRPRWNSSVHIGEKLTGHNFKPTSVTTPSPHSRPSPNATSATKAESKIPLKSPLSAGKSTPAVGTTTPLRNSASGLSYRERAGTGPQISPSVRPRHLTAQTSMSALSTASRRSSIQPTPSELTSRSGTPVRPTRAASSLANTRRSSLLPQPRGKALTGRESPQAVAGAARAMASSSSQTSTESKTKERKPWRP